MSKWFGKDLPVAVESLARVLDSSLLSRFKTSILENVVTNARPDTDRDNIVESKPIL